YIAICNPLRYSMIMTKVKVSTLLIFAWLSSICIILIVIVLSVRLPLCGSAIEKLYCDNVSIMMLSCVEPSINNIYGVIMAAIGIGVPLIIIIYSYIQILNVCLKISKEARTKAFHTCGTHLLTFFSFVIGALFVLIGNRVNSKSVPVFVSVILSLEFLLIPPLFNPTIYGVYNKEFFSIPKDNTVLQEQKSGILIIKNGIYICVFILSGFGKMDRAMFFYFACTLVLFLANTFVNIVLIAVIILEESLHEPIYICLCNLSFNELFGSCSLLPHLMANLLSETKSISYSGCFIQVFCLHTYGTIELLILSVMAYDRYVAICNPLRYSMIMTKVKVSKLLIFAWLSSISTILIVIVLSVRLPLCGSTIEKLHCDNVSVMKLSCVESTINNIYELIMIAIVIGVPLIIITYSVILFLEFLVIPPLINPTIYGVRTEQIRNAIGKLFRKRILP
uniref:G-protein coupled receptors family 1 profile domain-containing protein n=1 Tax=Latimeria chalumnae TaxID=7897 RepID=H2ZT75_LATCH